MKRTLKAPPKLTAEEKRKLQRVVWMADWHFEKLIKPSCTILSSLTVYWTGKGKDYHHVGADIYGLRAVKATTNELCIANIFVRCKTQVFQVHDIEDAVVIVNLLKKEREYDEYLDKKGELEMQEKKRLERQKSTQIGKVKKLRVVKGKAA